MCTWLCKEDIHPNVFPSTRAPAFMGELVSLPYGLEMEALLEELSSNPILNFSLFLSVPLLPLPHHHTHFWRHRLVVQLKLA